ncbi:hypothetical protein [Corynebacterium bovis]|uniref:Metallo-beta-lactamase domain-containing protein n=1 Tax=Corynebacterium bovis DSM 20582 = CIP 54.80 TaxID=927655 RepID=A0A8H9Y9W3_9CORY|nr:hypothetical protein [Corynebacterium bovis]MBB3116018.1 hypothetical protein [Corynebacterium bovis DSM 20582 = CIP 54.80]WJY76604.1 hypothetical protein CBOVI_00260 [Corynebacterium bovis DSM 20582 = CIP 54.80]
MTATPANTTATGAEPGTTTATGTATGTATATAPATTTPSGRPLPYSHTPGLAEARNLADHPTFRPIPEFEGVHEIWPRGDRLKAVREGARRYRERFLTQGRVLGVKSFDIAAAPYPSRFAFQGYSLNINPLISIINRMLVIQYEDFNGVPRTLVWEPTVADGSKKSPFYNKLAKFGEKFGGERLLARYYNDPEDILPSLGMDNSDVDYVSFDHLHVQDSRMIMGSTDDPEPGEAPFEPLFPRARMIVHEAELGTFESLHPMQTAWYVEEGMNGVDRDVLSTFSGDVEIGVGISLLWTPGHTDGNHSLCINTPDGIWISSENGMAADSWQPELSRIPGLSAQAKFYEREVVLNGNTLEDSLDQYDSMIKEKEMASNARKDARWKQILPSSECAPWKRQWPLIPGITHGGIDYGELRRRR